MAAQQLTKHFPVRARGFGGSQHIVRAVEDVSFALNRGQTLGLVGESGCGKTTVGRLTLRLLSATAGAVHFAGQNIFGLSGKELRQLRRRMQIIFQDPFGSLNPRLTVGEIVAEPLIVHRMARGKELQQRTAGLLKRVGLDAEAAERYPHEFSGGQRQRIGIARALALDPEFIVCDEPTSALDVSVRAQVLNLLAELQRERRISYLMISHDLAVVRQISHEVAVMYLGRIVEQAPTSALYAQPRHPYTRLLLAAVPQPDPQRRRELPAEIDDEIPSAIDIPSGCPFHPRCPLYREKDRPAECREHLPELLPVSREGNHFARCHFAHES